MESSRFAVLVGAPDAARGKGALYGAEPRGGSLNESQLTAFGEAIDTWSIGSIGLRGFLKKPRSIASAVTCQTTCPKQASLKLPMRSARTRIRATVMAR